VIDWSGVVFMTRNPVVHEGRETGWSSPWVFPTWEVRQSHHVTILNPCRPYPRKKGRLGLWRLRDMTLGHAYQPPRLKNLSQISMATFVTKFLLPEQTSPRNPIPLHNNFHRPIPQMSPLPKKNGTYSHYRNAFEERPVKPTTGGHETKKATLLDGNIGKAQRKYNRKSCHVEPLNQI